MKYEAKTYAKGFILKADPEDRTVDVMHYLNFGTLLGGRSLDGVTWDKTDIEDDEFMQKRAKQLAKAMRQPNKV